MADIQGNIKLKFLGPAFQGTDYTFVKELHPLFRLSYPGVKDPDNPASPGPVTPVTHGAHPRG